MGSSVLRLNGHERFQSQHGDYFRVRQPYQYHTNVPNTNLAKSDLHFQNDSSVTVEGMEKILLGHFGSVKAADDDTGDLTKVEQNQTLSSATGAKRNNMLAIGDNSSIDGHGRRLTSYNLANYVEKNKLEGSILEVTIGKLGRETIGLGSTDSTSITNNAQYLHFNFGFDSSSPETANSAHPTNPGNVDENQTQVFNTYLPNAELKEDSADKKLFLTRLSGVDTPTASNIDSRTTVLSGNTFRAIIKSASTTGENENRMGHVILENPLRSVYKKGLELLETVQTVKYSQECRIAGDGTSGSDDTPGLVNGCGFVVSLIPFNRVSASTSTLKKKNKCLLFCFKTRRTSTFGNL